MKNRRGFLKDSALSILGTPILFLPGHFINQQQNNASMVKQLEDCEIFYVRENTPITFHISKAVDNISSVSLLTEELLPGSKIPVHKHIHEDEYFYFLQGNGIMTIAEQNFIFKPGTAAFVPKNTWHGLINNADHNTLFMFGYTPAGFEGFFREIGTPKGQEFKPKPRVEFDSIAKKYGIVYQ